MEETISLKEIFEIIKKHIVLIITFVIGAALIAAVVSFFVLTPIYQSNTQFIVNQSQADGQTEQLTQSAIRSNIELINTYREIIRSNAILDEVIETLHLNHSVSALKSNIQVSSEQNSQVVTLSVKDSNPEVATLIANTTLEVFKDRVVELMNIADNVKVLSPAVTSENPSPVAPNPKLNIAIATILGLMVGVGVAFLINYLDTSVRTEEDVQEKLGVTLLGTISSVDQSDISDHLLRRNVQGRGGVQHVQAEKKRA